MAVFVIELFNLSFSLIKVYWNIILFNITLKVRFSFIYLFSIIALFFIIVQGYLKPLNILRERSKFAWFFVWIKMLWKAAETDCNNNHAFSSGDDCWMHSWTLVQEISWWKWECNSDELKALAEANPHSIVHELATEIGLCELTPTN